MATTQTCDLNQLLGTAQLPALPHSAVHLLELTRDDDNGPMEYAAPIEADPGLAGQILKFVNSSHFGFRNEVTNVRLAINLVGIRTIKNFALWSAVFSLSPGMQVGAFDIRLLWQDSLRRAIFAQEIGNRLNIDQQAEDLFTGALLQDLALPILMAELPEIYPQVFQHHISRGVPLAEIEREIFGWTHAEAGAYVAKKWKLPDSLCRHIDNHIKLDPRWSLSKALGSQLAISLSAELPDSFSEEWPRAENFKKIYNQLPRPERPLEEVFAQVDSAMEQFAPLLKLKTPSRPLMAFLEQ